MNALSQDFIRIKPRENVVALIEHLVKESEMYNLQPGRIFVIAGAERLTYRVLWNANTFAVERLNNGVTINTEYFIPKEFATHSIVEALASGQLYTPVVRALH
jgi:hypothetical protein